MNQKTIKDLIEFVKSKGAKFFKLTDNGFEIEFFTINSDSAISVKEPTAEELEIEAAFIKQFSAGR